jgi:hypothetical protein
MRKPFVITSIACLITGGLVVWLIPHLYLRAQVGSALLQVGPSPIMNVERPRRPLAPLPPGSSIQPFNGSYYYLGPLTSAERA